MFFIYALLLVCSLALYVCTRLIFTLKIRVLFKIILSLIVFFIIKIINIFIFSMFVTANYFILPVILSSYYILTLGSKKSATIGMDSMKFKLSIKNNYTFTKKTAFFHSLIFLITFPIAFITLTLFIYPILNKKRSCIHDIFYKVNFVETGEN